MKIEPRRDQVVGRFVIKRRPTVVVLTNEAAGVSKFIIADAIGPDAEAKGVKVGDMIVPRAVPTPKGLAYRFSAIITDEGQRPVIEEPDIVGIVSDLSLDEFLVQTESGAEYVPFDSEEAAKSIGTVKRKTENGHSETTAGATV